MWNVQFLSPESGEELDMPLYLSDPFVIGHTFAGSLLDSLLSAVCTINCSSVVHVMCNADMSI